MRVVSDLNQDAWFLSKNSTLSMCPDVRAVKGQGDGSDLPLLPYAKHCRCADQSLIAVAVVQCHLRVYGWWIKRERKRVLEKHVLFFF